MTRERFDAEDLRLFALIYQAGGVTAAERRYGVPKATLSRTLTRLERAAAGVLFDRVSRGMRPTSLGDALHEHACDIARSYDATVELLRSTAAEPFGQIVVAGGPSTTEFLIAPAMAAFKRQHPDVAIASRITVEAPDPNEDGIDLAVQVGWPSKPHLVARRLVSDRTALYVAAQGVEAGAVDHPRDLGAIGRVVIDAPDAPQDWVAAWTLVRAEETFELDTTPLMTVGDPAVAAAIVSDGHGIVLLPEFYGNVSVAQGRLRRVLPDWHGPDLELFAALPAGRTRVPAVRAFLDTLIKVGRRTTSAARPAG